MGRGVQYSLAYALSEIALIAIALAAGRMALLPLAVLLEARTVCFCVAMTATCGALGGLCLRMTVGLMAGGIFSIASIPLLCLVISKSF
jgi:hypothetical protein